MAILIVHQVDFRAKKIARDSGTLCNGKWVSPWNCKEPKCVHTTPPSCSVFTVKIGRNRYLGGLVG